MSGREEKISHMRLSVVQYAALAIFLILSYGLWSLQIRKSDEYESMAQQNRVHYSAKSHCDRSVTNFLRRVNRNRKSQIRFVPVSKILIIYL